MLNHKVSVIIPIYGQEKYIERCARSLFEQSLKSIEYIFVDDCTPDNSIDILEKVADDYPDRKDHIKIIHHKSNVGVSMSRQDGMTMASGEYVIHCDPDDWVEKDMYETLYAKASGENLDVVICDFSAESDSVEVISQRPAECKSASVLGSISGRHLKPLHGSLCNKLIKADCLADVKFPPGVNYCEDVFVLFQVFKGERNIGYVDKAMYHYRVDVPNSLVKTVDRKALDMDMKLIEKLHELGLDSNSDEYVRCANSMILSVIYHRAFMQGNVSGRDFKDRYSGMVRLYLPDNLSIRQPYRMLLQLSGYGFHSLSMSLLKAARKVKSFLKH